MLTRVSFLWRIDVISVGAGGGSVAHVSAGIELRQQLAQERAHIRHQAESDGIIARDLVGIDIHMDELGRRNGE